MLNALKLYADNLLCMDLCCFSGSEATALVGDQVSQCVPSVGPDLTLAHDVVGVPVLSPEAAAVEEKADCW